MSEGAIEGPLVVKFENNVDLRKAESKPSVCGRHDARNDRAGVGWPLCLP